MSQALEKILEEVKTLSEEDRHQLAAMLHEINCSARASAGEHGFESKLAAEGWLTLPVAPASERAPLARMNAASGAMLQHCCKGKSYEAGDYILGESYP